MKVKMRVKKYTGLILLIMLAFLAQGITARADELTGASDWTVLFKSSKEMESNFPPRAFADVLDYMQPGDSALFYVKIKNEYETATDWYMTNEVLKSLEDASKTASGGAYSYILTYTDAKGNEKTLYNSDKVGGEMYSENLEGLHEATDSLKEFFFLDTLGTNESGRVSLYVKLDGETQGNSYQDTLAQLQINFAVELPTVIEDHDRKERREERYVENRIVITENDSYTIEDEDVALSNNNIIRVRTGDDTDMTLLLVIAGVLGTALFILGCIGFRLGRQMKEGR